MFSTSLHSLNLWSTQTCATSSFPLVYLHLNCFRRFSCHNYFNNYLYSFLFYHKPLHNRVWLKENIFTVIFSTQVQQFNKENCYQPLTATVAVQLYGIVRAHAVWLVLASTQKAALGVTGDLLVHFLARFLGYDIKTSENEANNDKVRLPNIKGFRVN